MRFTKPAALTYLGLAFAVTLGVLATPAQAAGLPQLDIAKFPPQVVWLVISFIVLYVIMAKTALPRIGQILEERQQRIEDNLNKAEQLRADAQAAADAYETSLSQSRSIAQGILRDTREAAAAQAAKRQEELADRLSNEISDAEARIADAKDKALGDVQSIAADIAAGTAAKLIGEDIDAATAATAVDAVEESK